MDTASSFIADRAPLDASIDFGSIRLANNQLKKYSHERHTPIGLIKNTTAVFKNATVSSLRHLEGKGYG
jgi:hypothetical protein